jgi:hypothetical protein
MKLPKAWELALRIMSFAPAGRAGSVAGDSPNQPNQNIIIVVQGIYTSQ